MIASRDKGYDDSLCGSLKDLHEAAAYVDAVLDLDDPATLLVALRQVARAHGLAKGTRRAHVGDKTLFRTLSKGGIPTVFTLQKVLRTVSLRLSVTPAHAGAVSAPGCTDGGA